MKVLSCEKRKVSADEDTIVFTLERKDIQNINLRIKNDGQIFVSAPSGVSSEYIDSFVISKKNYIKKAVDGFLADIEPRAELQFVSGENVTLLGRNMRLSIEKDLFESVDCDGVFVHIHVFRTDIKKRMKELFEAWIDEQCRSIFDEVMHEVHKRFIPYGVEYPELKIREMTSRWGSCLPKKGIITLNKRLIEAPKYCIEYVIYHEFCHFIHPDHSKAFYTLLQIMLPEWKECKKVLEKSVRF